MMYNKPESWTKSFIVWHIDFIKTMCEIELHLKQGCIHCEGVLK